jgi:4-amino-4-deoxy-L-arabinose transferase-like glycosyltransferase
MNQRRGIGMLIGLIALSVSLLTINLGNTHLWDQDEGFYAAAAAEMYTRNDWITPTFNGKLFGHKPPMMYWGMMLGYRAFGVSEFGARFVSSLFGVGTVFLTYWIARRLFDATTGFFAGLAMTSCIMFVLVARSATADAHLTFFTALALFVWIRSYFSSDAPTRELRLKGMRWSDWALTYASLGLAVLTKGPIGLLFPMAVIGLFLLTELHADMPPSRPRIWSRFLAFVRPYSPVPFLGTVWRMRPFTAVAMILLTAGPWYVLVQLKTDGEFLREFIGVHHLGRFSHAMDNHSGPIYYYLLACLVGLFPWSAFAIPTSIAWVTQSRDRTSNRSFRFITCWIGVYVVIFSLASTKLPNYVLPAYPALAIVVGRYFATWVQSGASLSRNWMNAGWLVFVLIGLLVGCGIPATAIVRFDGSTLLERLQMDIHEQTRWMTLGLVGAPMVVLGLLGWWYVRGRDDVRSVGVFCVANAILVAMLCQWVAPEIDRYQAPQTLAQAWNHHDLNRTARVQVLGIFRPSMVFYFGRDVQFTDSPEEVLLNISQLPSSILVTTETQFDRIKDRLPEGSQVLQRVAQFPDGDELMVIGDKSLIR